MKPLKFNQISFCLDAIQTKKTRKIAKLKYERKANYHRLNRSENKNN